jgi:hypothetical protein
MMAGAFERVPHRCAATPVDRCAHGYPAGPRNHRSSSGVPGRPDVLGVGNSRGLPVDGYHGSARDDSLRGHVSSLDVRLSLPRLGRSLGKSHHPILLGSACDWNVDNLLYPTLVGSKLQMHTAPLFFSVLGGIVLFGATGILLGPLVLAAFFALLRMWNEENSG